MKKFIASAGLVTVGTVSLQAAYAPGLSTMETTKPWSISATLRGFYDDNYNNAPSHSSNPGIPSAKSSGGFELSPRIAVNFPMEQTYLSASYLYSLKYYFDRPNNEADHLHEFTLKADHRFNERYRVGFNDSFVYSVEPDIIDSSGPITSFQRQKSDAVRNRAIIDFSAQLTELLGVAASYENTWYKYLDNDTLEAELDRFEHLFDVHGTWLLQEHLTVLFGYQYGIYDYTSDKKLNPADPNSLNGGDRDSTSHYFYGGLEHAFSSQLNGSLRIGAQYTEYDKLSGSSGTWNPYADVRGTYTYLPGSYVQLGITHTRNATDVVGAGTAADIVKDQESTTLFGSINHRITPRLTGSLLGQFQRSVYSGGSLDGDVDYYLLVGVNLEYKINNNWAAEIGYNFDRLDSDLADRSFSRNRIYGGVRASF